MKVIYIDPSAGISGDMTIAAFLDLGMPFDHLKKQLDLLELDGYSISTEETKSGSLRGVKFKVDAQTHKEESNHHDHTNHSHTRGLKEIKDIITSSGLSEKIKTKAIEMFELLAEVEGKVHGKSPKEVHFHEVGAVDSIVDIIGACIAFDYFSPDFVVCGNVNLGSGSVNTAHGRLPVPPPAVAELIKGVPAFSDDSGVELTTPTGALILKTFVNRFAPFPLMRTEKIGYGAGTRELPNRSNILRLFLGETDEVPELKEESITVLEAEIDDMQPELFGYLMERVQEIPVLDLYFTSIQMKKNRPGVLFTVLIEKQLTGKAVELILTETTSLCVRRYDINRYCLDRDYVNVETRYGKVRMKIGKAGGRVLNISPEYEDCKELAIKNNIPLKSVINEVIRKYKEKEKN
jgi:uncharacterized protein (TIGR00299 family) protein